MKLKGLLTLGLLLSTFLVRAQTGTDYPAPTLPDPLPFSSACQLSTVSFDFTIKDDGRQNGNYDVVIYNSANTPITNFSNQGQYIGVVTTKPAGQYTAVNKARATFTLPTTLAGGGGYYFIVFSQTTPAGKTYANKSGIFTIKPLPTAIISDGNPNIKAGEAAAIKVTFSGDGPWSFSYDELNGTIHMKSNETLNPVYLYINPTSDYLFDASKFTFSGACGTGTSSGSSQIRVSKLTISTSKLSASDICPGRDQFSVQYSIDGTPPGGVTYTAQISDINGNFGNPTTIGSGTSNPISCDPKLMASLSPGSTYKVRVIANNNAIQWSGSSLSISLKRTDLPLVTPLTYCQNSTPASLLSSVNGSSIFWYNYTVNGGGDIPYNKPTPPTPPNTAGTYKYQISQTVNGCESALQYLTVTVTGKSNPPGDATIEYCKGAQASPLTTSASSPIWYNGSTQLPGAPTPPTDNATTLTYKVAQGGSCPSDQSTITVKIKDLPAAPTFTPLAPICQNGPSQVLSASGMGSLQWYDGNNSPLPSAPTPALGNTNAQTYYVTQTVNGCTSSKATIVQTFTPAPGPPTATSPAPVCKDAASVQLSASGSGTIKWYNNANGSLPNAPLQSTNVPGIFMYQVSQAVSGCESSRVDLKVVVNDKSAAPQATPSVICQNASVAGVSLANGTNLQWFKADGTLIGSTLTLVSTGDGAQTYKVSQETNGCRSDQVTTTLTVTKLPDPPGVTAPAPLCQFTKDADVPVLIATASSGGTLHWFDPNGSQLPGAPKPGTQTAGSITYSVSQNVSNCESAAKTPVIQVIKPASDKPTVVTPVLYCRAQTVTALTAGGENLKWYDANDNPITDITPKTTNVGSTVYLVRQTVTANGCASAPASLTVLVQDAPGAPVVSSVPACLGKDLPITDLVKAVTGNNAYTWYLVQSGGTGTTVAPTISTSAIGNQSVFVTQKTGNCEGPRAELKVVVNPIPAAPAATDPGPLCQYQLVTASSFTAQGMSLLWYANGQTTATAQPAVTDTNLPTSFTVAVTQTVSTCVSPPKVLTQVVNPAPPLPTGTPLQLCLNDASKSLSAAALPGNSLTWYGMNMTGGTPSATAPVITAGSVRTDTYYFTQTDGTTKCESKRQSVVAKIDNKPGPPTVTASQFACLNTTPIALSATASNSQVWSSPLVSTTSATGPTPPTNTVTTTPYRYTVVQVLGSCVSDASFIDYSIKPLPAAPTLQSPQVACVGQPALNLVAVGQNLKWYKDPALTAALTPSVPTTQSLSETWYVTQTDGNGCQSATATPLDVKIRSQATAMLSGDDRITAYDSTAIRIKLGGDGPWTMTLWDGTTVTKTLKNPYIKWERPLATRTYSITTLSNDCGVGVASNTYTLIVDKPLGVDPLSPATLSMTVSPNPTTGLLNVEWSAVKRQPVRLRFLSAAGAVVWQAERVGTGNPQTETIQVGDRPAGIYFLQLQSDSAGLLVRKLVKQ